MDADGGNLRVLTNNTMPDLTPNWTPDGSKIIFHRSIGGFNQLHIMNADGTDVQQLTATVGHNLFANPGYVRVGPGRGESPRRRGLRIAAIAQGVRRLGGFEP
jgi:Tol biopolymer transport system component